MVLGRSAGRAARPSLGIRSAIWLQSNPLPSRRPKTQTLNLSPYPIEPVTLFPFREFGVVPVLRYECGTGTDCLQAVGRGVALSATERLPPLSR